jgi:hypothetical protein
LSDFTEWLEAYGETSWDFQSLYAGPIGGRAKAFYYRHRLVGTAVVAPMVLCEALLPAARRLFHHRMRFPIADAHYAMGFAFLYQTTAKPVYLQKAMHFLTALKENRSSGFKEYCWGYPFNWVWHGGVIKSQTPLITTTPYVYEAFLQVYEVLRNNSELNSVSSARCPPSSVLRPLDFLDDYKQIVESIARHAFIDIKDFPTSEGASSCSYTPFAEEGGVINAAAYRAFLLTSAARMFSNKDYGKTAERNLNFVLENQNADGSWYYAVDGLRDFVDHFHTCFVMKSLAKVHSLTGHLATLEALKKGVSYYLNHLFASDGLPKPFSRAPRLTVYKRELYDCAECINLCLLLRDRFPQLEVTLRTVVDGVSDWIKPDGSFRSRRLYWGWDNVPMHRWGQSQMFRSLAFYLHETSKHRSQRLEGRDQMSEVSGLKSMISE